MIIIIIQSNSLFICLLPQEPKGNFEYKTNWIQHVNEMHGNNLKIIEKLQTPYVSANWERSLENVLDEKGWNGSKFIRSPLTAI
jgi:hypothetical protein